MDKSVALVLRGFSELNPKQREEFVQEVNKLIEGRTTKELLHKSLSESIRGQTINFGPAPGGCPCCGK